MINKNKLLPKAQRVCFDILIFMICSGIVHNLYSDYLWLGSFGGLIAVFGFTPISEIIWDKYKEIRKKEFSKGEMN